MAVDKRKVKFVMSMVALSLAFGFNVEYMVGNIPDAPVEMIVVEERQLKITRHGRVSEQSVKRVKEILQKSLTAAAYQFVADNANITVVDKDSAEHYISQNYGSSEQLSVGSKVANTSGIQMMVLAERVEDMVPQIASILQSYCDSINVGL